MSAVIAELSSGQTTEADQTAFSILDAVSALVLVIDPKGFIVRANDAAVRVTGYQPSDVKGRPVWDFLSDPIERRYVRATFSFLRPERFPNQFEYTLVTKDGQLKPIAWSNDLILNQAGEMSYMIATGIDLSDVRRVGQELVRSEAQNRALLDAIPDVMMRMDRTGVFLSCSISGESALFFPNGSFIGRNLKEVLPGDLALEISNAVQRAFESGELQVFEYNLKLDGQTRYYEARLTTSGENEVLSIIRDVTEQKYSAERLRRRDAILEVVNFAAERFLEEQDWRGQIQEVLARLGQATDASRVYLFENHLQPGAPLSNCLSYEWASPGVESQQLNTELMAATYLDPGVSRLVEAMRRGETIAGHVKDFTPAERTILGCQNVLSLVIVPIFLRQEYWGFIGLDECRVEREWSDSEVEALEAAASLIGSAIERARMSQALMVTLQISQAAHSTQDLDQLYKLIHESVGQLMPASSFYIALYDRNSDLITFPYFIDEFEEAAPPTRPGKGLTEYVLRTGKALLASPEVFYQLEKSGEVESVGPPSIDWLGAPLQSQGRTIGVLVVQSYTEGVRYRESDRDILSFVSTQVANTIERKQAEQALQRQLVELSVLHAVALAGAEAQTEDELIERATALIGRMLYTDSFGLLLLNPDGTELHFHPSYHGLPEEVKTSTVIPIGRGAAGRVAASGRPLYISDTDQDQEYIHLTGSSRSELCVPLKIGERIIGVINAERSSPQAFSPADERLLLTLASQMATAIERRRTETALRASEELYRTLVDTSPDWIIMIDLDGRVLLMNEVMIRGMGFANLEQVRGLNAYQEFISEDQIEAVKEAERQLLEGKLVAGEYMIRRRDGHSIPVELNASLILDADGSRRGFIGILRDITERKRRDHEREAIISVAGALRAAHTRAEMIPIILEHLIALLKAEASALVSGNFSEGVLSVELGSGRWKHLTGQELSPVDDVTHRVVSTGEAHYTSRDGLQSACAPFQGLPEAACVPLLVENQPVGLIWLGSENPLSLEETSILTAVADMAANALHRAALHEETQRRVQRLAALRSVDMAITASLDLRVALNVLLDQLTVQLNVDASDVLLYNPHSRTLDYSAGRGFRTTRIRHNSLRMGANPAGTAAVERRSIHILDLEEEVSVFLRDRGLLGESFKSYYAVPLVAKGDLKGLLEVFHRAPLRPDEEWVDFLETLAGQAAIAVDNSILFTDLQRSNMELGLAYDTTLEGWVHALDLRDQETEGHTQRVMELTLRLARALGRTDEEMVHIRRGVLLHDIGKIAIPDSILLKRGPLTDEEWNIMRRHPVYAYELLSPINYLHQALEIPYCHHEKWDGSGYPRGLKGDQIPRSARIFAVVDVWDALRSDRPYRKAWPAGQVIEYIRSQSGKHFDPQIVPVFFQILKQHEI